LFESAREPGRLALDGVKSMRLVSVCWRSKLQIGKVTFVNPE
jgi:hypothetical protein